MVVKTKNDTSCRRSCWSKLLIIVLVVAGNPKGSSSFQQFTPSFLSKQSRRFRQQHFQYHPFAIDIFSTTAVKTTSWSLGMFTGIVEEMGTVVSLQEQDRMTLWDGSTGKGTELIIQGKTVLEDAYLGCSICVSGVCLTATELDFDKEQFKVGLAPETLRRTYFQSLQPGDKVNLERASEIGGRNSGHFVQGHVDGVGTIIQRQPDQDSLVYHIQVPPELIKYIVPKGFVAVDGTSLTVVNVHPQEGWFSFMLVDYSQKHVIIPSKQVGDVVNIEVDVLGKYSESALAALLPRLEALEAKVETLEQQLMLLVNTSNNKKS